MLKLLLKLTFGNSVLSLGRSIIIGFRVRSNSFAKLNINIAPKENQSK